MKRKRKVIFPSNHATTTLSAENGRYRADRTASISARRPAYNAKRDAHTKTFSASLHPDDDGVLLQITEHITIDQDDLPFQAVLLRKE